MVDASLWWLCRLCLTIQQKCTNIMIRMSCWSVLELVNLLWVVVGLSVVIHLWEKDVLALAEFHLSHCCHSSVSFQAWASKKMKKNKQRTWWAGKFCWRLHWERCWASQSKLHTPSKQLFSSYMGWWTYRFVGSRFFGYWLWCFPFRAFR